MVEDEGRVRAKPDFDPWCCQWCGDTGFDLKGLAHHVWTRCEVVERLAEENAEDVRAWHQRAHEEHWRRKRDSDGSRDGRDAQRLDGEAATARAGTASPSLKAPQPPSTTNGEG